jgi:hypothetical protein
MLTAAAMVFLGFLNFIKSKTRPFTVSVQPAALILPLNVMVSGVVI